MAQVGFAVTLTGELLAPSPLSRAETRVFIDNNNRFLANRESAEVYLNPGLNSSPGNKDLAGNSFANSQAPSERSESTPDYGNRFGKSKTPLTRNVVPQQQLAVQRPSQQPELQHQYSKLAPSEAEFRQLIGQDSEGMLARFVDNKLSVLLWCRVPADQCDPGVRRHHRLWLLLEEARTAESENTGHPERSVPGGSRGRRACPLLRIGHP